MQKENVYVLALCTPAILGSVGLWALGADLLPAGAAGLVGQFAVWLFLMAAYGPLLVPLGSVQAILLTRRLPGSSATCTAWATVCAGVVAAAVFWQVGIDTAPLP